LGVSFEEYLISKKIDSQSFRNADPDRWEAWQKEFTELHPNSFTARNLYLINPVRRKHPLQEPVKK
jgi:hypothetical protein